MSPQFVEYMPSYINGLDKQSCNLGFIHPLMTGPVGSKGELRQMQGFGQLDSQLDLRLLDYSFFPN